VDNSDAISVSPGSSCYLCYTLSVRINDLMNLKEQTTPEAVSTDNRILLKSHARFFIVPAVISCLLLAAVSVIIFMNIEVPDSFSVEILMVLVPLLFLVRIAWQIPDYIKAPEYVLVDFENRMLTVNPGKPDAREILFSDILRMKYSSNLYLFATAHNFYLKLATGSMTTPLLIAMRSDSMSNALYFALQNKGGIEMQQDGVAASVRPRNRSTDREPDLQGMAADPALIAVNSVRYAHSIFSVGRAGVLAVFIFAMLQLLSTWVLALVIIGCLVILVIYSRRLFQKYLISLWNNKKIVFDPTNRVINEYAGSKTNQIHFDDIDYIRFEASSALSSKYTDYLFWIRPKGFRERPLFAVTEDAAATEYYFILQNELGIPMRQD
jgi:hypothetical protein